MKQRYLLLKFNMRELTSWVFTVLIGLLVGYAVIFYANEEQSVFNGDYSMYFNNIEEDIIVVSVPWCEYCQQLKALLDKHKVNYFIFNPTLTENTTSVYQHLNVNHFPVVVTSSIKIIGFQPQLITSLPEFVGER